MDAKIAALLAVVGLMLMLATPAASAHDFYMADGKDDAAERGGGAFYPDASTARVYSNVVTTGSGYRCAGFRFENVHIPQGQNIENAHIEFYAKDRQNINCWIYAENVDNSLDFDALPYIIDNAQRPKTDNVVSWSENGIGLQSLENTDNISSIIQEVVNRENWVSGNAITILFIAKTDQTLQCSFATFDDAVNPAAVLRVFWEPEINGTFYPVTALPRSTVYISQRLESHGNGMSDISAKINFSDNTCPTGFVMVNGLLENDNVIDDCPDGEWVIGEWFAATPSESGSYDFNITWSFIHDNRHVHTSDNFTIYVQYPTSPGTVDDGSLAMMVLGVMIALCAIVVVSRSRPIERKT